MDKCLENLESFVAERLVMDYVSPLHQDWEISEQEKIIVLVGLFLAWLR